MKFVLIKHDTRPTWVYRASGIAAGWTCELRKAAEFLTIDGARVEVDRLCSKYPAADWRFTVHALVPADSGLEPDFFSRAAGYKGLQLGPEVWPDPKPDLVTVLGILACED